RMGNGSAIYMLVRRQPMCQVDPGRQVPLQGHYEPLLYYATHPGVAQRARRL
ncbi:hypothetical protein BGZ94_010286, partial [Podila epigama]